MRSLPLVIIVLVVTLIGIFTQLTLGDVTTRDPGPKSPHGDNFKVSCSVCHSSKGWKIDKEVYSFDHGTTKMPLVGQHTNVDCMLCHKTLIFSDAKKECVGCHTDVHESTVGSQCNRCHTPQSWLVNNITTIHQQSRFPLLGVHSSIDCYQCHKSETFRRFEVLGTDCYSCHSANYAATTQPNHASSGYSVQCTECHTVFSTEWKGTGFDHSYFPLVQGHASINCIACHTAGKFTKISSDCVACHQTNFNATTNPNHRALNFSTTCTTCHSLAPGWKPTTFDHSKFPLTQGHAINDCAKCHANGNYTTTSKECSSCHLSNYNATTNPNHQALNFATACSSCHTTLPGWKPASYTQHDALSFPIYSGKHRGQWTSCVDCHANTGNYKVFSCIDCHTHNKTSMDSKHKGEKGYAYNSASCLNCHPKGSN